MRYSEKLLQAGGVTVVTADLSEMMGSAGKISDTDAELLTKLDRIRAYGTIPAHIKPEQIARQAKWSLAVDRWISENACAARAIQCLR